MLIKTFLTLFTGFYEDTYLNKYRLTSVILKIMGIIRWTKTNAFWIQYLITSKIGTRGIYLACVDLSTKFMILKSE